MNSCMNCLEEEQIRQCILLLQSSYEERRCKGEPPAEAIAKASVDAAIAFEQKSIWNSPFVVVPGVLLFGGGIIGGMGYGIYWFFDKLTRGGM